MNQEFTLFLIFRALQSFVAKMFVAGIGTDIPPNASEGWGQMSIESRSEACVLALMLLLLLLLHSKFATRVVET